MRRKSHPDATLILRNGPKQTFETPDIRQNINDFEKFMNEQNQYYSSTEVTTTNPMSFTVSPVCAPKVNVDPDNNSSLPNVGRHSLEHMYKNNNNSGEISGITNTIEKTPKIDLAISNDGFSFSKRNQTSINKKTEKSDTQVSNNSDITIPTNRLMTSKFFILDDDINNSKYFKDSFANTSQIRQRKNLDIVKLINDSKLEYIFCPSIKISLPKNLPIRFKEFLENAFLRMKKENANMLEGLSRIPSTVVHNLLDIQEPQRTRVIKSISLKQRGYFLRSYVELLRRILDINKEAHKYHSENLKIIKELDGIINNSGSDNLIRFTEEDILRKKREIDEMKKSKADASSEEKYRFILKVLPFNIVNLETNQVAPTVTFRQNCKNITVNALNANVLYQRYNREFYRENLRKDIRDLYKLTSHLLFDGDLLKFSISGLKKQRTRFTIIMKVPQSYPWCRLRIFRLNIDFAEDKSSLQFDLNSILDKIPMGPRMLVRYATVINNKYVV